jgi:CYTH domain-containing protein
LRQNAGVLRRTPGTGPYARTEREQRWLLRELPEGLVDPVDIDDRYVTGTTLRVRRMRARTGSATAYKLGQKVRAAAGSPERVSLTNMYLREDEFELLRRLDGAALQKTRWQWPTGAHALSVDEFAGPLTGLVLAEIELDDDTAFLEMPPLAVADVTAEDRFSGGSLAHLADEAAAALVTWVAERVRDGN